jgi:serine/threonine protein kinase
MNATSGTAPPTGRGDPFGLVGARLDSRYEVGELVAQGGFGVVYRAQHRELRKPVAIKVLKTPTDFTPRQQADFLRRFQEEARTVAQLDHPHIVRVLDFGTSIMPSGARAPWMALEWLEGVTLESDFDARIQTGSGGRSPAECAALMFPVVEAVGVAHDEGVVHRDIKPSNLMIVTGRRGDPRLKLLDFGIAKVMAPEERRSADRAQTLTQVQAFSPDYAAPEQVSGTRTGPWTDVHSLALLMSEMLTAAVPFEGADTMEMCANVLAPRRPTPGRFGVDVGPWEPVLARALSLDPSSRYSNASEFLNALMDNLPPGVSPAEVQHRVSQTGAPRPTPNIPTPADGISPLKGARVEQLAPTARPPSMLDLGRAPTLLAATSQPPPPEHFEPAAESELDEPEMRSAPTSPPPSPGSPSFLPPSHQQAIPTEPLARPRSFVAPLLVVIGLFFGGLVASAVVLLLRPASTVVIRTSHPLASPPSLPPPAVVAVAPDPVVPAVPSIVDASAAVPAIVDASAVDAPAIVDASAVDAPAIVDASAVDEPPRHLSSRHRSRHGHRHHHHRSRVPAE